MIGLIHIAIVILVLISNVDGIEVCVTSNEDCISGSFRYGLGDKTYVDTVMFNDDFWNTIREIIRSTGYPIGYH
jgi:hypothetical protein